MNAIKTFALSLVLAVGAFAQIQVPYTYSANNPSPNAPGGNCVINTAPVYNFLTGVYWYCVPNTAPPTNLGTWTSYSLPTGVLSINASGQLTTATAAQIGAVGVTALTVAPTPAVAAGVALGSAALPFGSAYLGTAATNNQRILPTATSAARSVNLADQGTNGAVAFGDQTDPTKVVLIDSHSATASTTLTISEAITASRTLTIPDINVGVPSFVTCAATAACPSTAQSTMHVVFGTGSLSSGSPSTYAVTTIAPAFTSSSTYTCTAQDTTTIANNIGVLAAGYVSGSAVTFTGPNTNTDGFHFVCVGY